MATVLGEKASQAPPFVLNRPERRELSIRPVV